MNQPYLLEAYIMCKIKRGPGVTYYQELKKFGLKRGLIAGIIIISGLISCNKISPKKDITEGVIRYDITYLENNLDNISTHLLPKKMVLRFNEHYSLTEIEGFMGMFSIKLISNYKNNTETTMVKFFDNKYVHFGEKNEQSSIFQFMEFTSMDFTEDSSIIAGFPAQKIRITEKDFTSPLEIYHTDRIGCQYPNRNNPYRKINGVLLEFVLQLSHMRMNLKANEIINKPVSNEVFSVPEEYKAVSAENMAYLIEKMMESN